MTIATMHDALYIAAKAPRAGLAKTRLGRHIGHPAAIGLYRAFLRDLSARLVSVPARCGCTLGWYITPPDAWGGQVRTSPPPATVRSCGPVSRL